VIRSVRAGTVGNNFFSVRGWKYVFLVLSPVVIVLYYHYNSYRNGAHLITF